MKVDDPCYYQRRAEDHVRLAQQSLNSRVVQVHYKLATCYLDRLYPQEQPPSDPA